MPKSSTLPFILLYAENLPNEEANRANLIFSPSAGGAIQDPNSHPIENESTRDIDGDELSDSTRDI